MSHLDDSVPQEKAVLNQSIERLMQEHYPYIRRLALSILDDPHEADDAAQETFIAASRAWGSFRGESSPRTWLTAITINTCCGRLRKHKTRRGLQTALQALHLTRLHDLSPEEALIQQDTHQTLRLAVGDLDEKHRLPILLRYVHKLSIAEIAAALHTNSGTIYSRLYYARRMQIARLDIQSPTEEASNEKPSPPDA